MSRLTFTSGVQLGTTQTTFWSTAPHEWFSLSCGKAKQMKKQKKKIDGSTEGVTSWSGSGDAAVSSAQCLQCLNQWFCRPGSAAHGGKFVQSALRPLFPFSPAKVVDLDRFKPHFYSQREQLCPRRLPAPSNETQIH